MPARPRARSHSLVPSLLAAIAVFGAMTPGHAADWAPDASASRIDFSGTYAGQAFQGAFKTWRAEIAFDPADLAHARVAAVIDVASAKTGSALYDGTLPQAEWLDAKGAPEATFIADGFTSQGPGRYEAAGRLKLKGRETPVALPFALTIEGDQARMTGSVVLDRLALDVGAKSDPKAEWVGRAIKVDLLVIARKR